MAAEALDFLAPPATLDQADAQQHVLGVDAYAIAAGLCTGLRWWRPTNAPAIQCVGVMWLLSDPSAPVVSKNINAATSGYNDFLWDTPIAWAANVHYIVAVLTDRYAFTSPGGWPFQSDSLRADAGVNARLALNTGGALTFPSAIHSGGANFFVSPLFERTSVSASASLSAQSSMSVSAQVTAMAAASLSAQGTLSVSVLAGQPPGVHVASGSALSTLTASGTAGSTLTASGTP